MTDLSTMTHAKWDRLTPAEQDKLRDLSGLIPELRGKEGERIEVHYPPLDGFPAWSHRFMSDARPGGSRATSRFHDATQSAARKCTGHPAPHSDNSANASTTEIAPHSEARRGRRVEDRPSAMSGASRPPRSG
jgi:hypothetical protein